jgi:hypothetical protein
MFRFTAFASALVAILAIAAPAPSQPKETPGYWQFVEMTRVEYPVEKVHRVYPVAFAFDGNKLTAVAKALNGNDLKTVHTEEQQVWSWAAPPRILVPGEKFPMRFELKLDRTKFDKSPGFYIGGRMNAGFQPPKPQGAAAYHVGGDTRTEKGEPGGLDPREKSQGGALFASGTYSRDSFVTVPGRKNAFNVKEHPDQISFRVGGAIGNSREFNTIYEYKWVEGAPPADRGGAAGEKPADKPTGGAGAASGKWEYQVLDIPVDQALGERLIKRLAELGDAGWELTGVIVPPTTPNASPVSIRLILKRPKK